MRQFVHIACCVIGLLLPAVKTVAQFIESSKSLGIDHISVSPNLIGGGVVSFDYNNDGWQDLYFTSGVNKDVLYKNVNGEKFELVDIPELAFTGRFNTSGAISGDFNNDGCQDLLVVTLSIDPTLLFINNCDGSFSLEFLHVTDEDGEYVSSSGAIASDFNQDGLLDIYLLNYVKDHHFLEDSAGRIIGYDHDCYLNSLLINQGEFKFEPISTSLLSGSEGCTLAGSSSRFIGEEHNGVYIVNDFGEWIYPNELKDSINNSVQGLDEAIYGMGVAIYDFDHDEDYDLYLTNIGKNKFLVNDQGNFQNEAALYDIENELTSDSVSVVSWGTIFLDIDNDAEADLFVSNGFVPVPEFLSSSIVNQNKLFRNTGEEFVDITASAGLDGNGIHRGAIYTDINNDGRLDIVTSVVSDSDLGTNDIKRSKVFINDFEEVNNYLQIYLEGVESNRNGINAEVKVYTNKKVQSQIMFSGTSYASQSLGALHFGLGETESVDSIKVIWPSGSISIFNDIIPNQQILIQENGDRILLLSCLEEGASNYSSQGDINFGCITTTTSDFEVSVPDNALIIFPNPTSGLVNVSVQIINHHTLQVNVFNQLGQVVFTSQGNQKDRYELDLSHLVSGLYYVQVNISVLGSLYERIYIKR